MRWVEVAPAAPALIEALPPLLILAGLLFALGCIVLIDAFVRGVAGLVAKAFSLIPFVGSAISAAIHAGAQAVSNELGKGIAGIERGIAHQFHNLARVVQHLWHTLERMAEVTWQIAQYVPGLAQIKNLAHNIRDLVHLIKRALHLARVAWNKAHHVETIVVHSVAHGVYPRLRAVEHKVSVTLPREIKSARALAREAEDGVARLWDRVKSLEAKISDTAVAAAVVAVLAAIGLDWLACRDGASRVGRSKCGLWDDLGDVFGLLAAAAIAVEFEQFVHDAQAATEATAEAVKDFAGIG